MLVSFVFEKKTLTISMVGSGHFLNLFNGVGKRYSQPRITQTAVTVIYPSIKHKNFSCKHFSLMLKLGSHSIYMTAGME